MAKNIYNDLCLIISEKISMYSTPYTAENFRAMKLALYFSMEPLRLNLILKSHLQPIALQLLSSGV